MSLRGHCGEDGDDMAHRSGDMAIAGKAHREWWVARREKEGRADHAALGRDRQKRKWASLGGERKREKKEEKRKRGWAGPAQFWPNSDFEVFNFLSTFLCF